MSRRFTIVGLAALCAFALCALSVGSASAAENTAVTCVEGGTEFGNADCSSVGTGWKHETILPKTSTQLTLKTIALEPLQVLTATPGAALIELQATEIECTGCMAENIQEASGAMKVEGSGGTIDYGNVTVAGNPNCEVFGTVKGVKTTGKIETKPLKFTTGATREAVISPVTAPVLAEFEIASKEKLICNSNLLGTYKVNGDVNGTANGSILTVNVTAAQKTVKLGVANASLSGKATVEAGPTEGVHHPAALT